MLKTNGTHYSKKRLLASILAKKDPKSPGNKFFKFY